MSEGDPRLGMFENDVSGFGKVLDRQALKSIGAVPAVEAKSWKPKCLRKSKLTLRVLPIRREPDPLTEQFERTRISCHGVRPYFSALKVGLVGLTACGTHGVGTCNHHAEVSRSSVMLQVACPMDCCYEPRVPTTKTARKESLASLKAVGCTMRHSNPNSRKWYQK